MLKALTTYMLQVLTAAGSAAPRSAPGHSVCPGGLETAASGPSAPAPLPVGEGTLNYSLENCLASPGSPPCMILYLQKSSQPPELKARKGVSLVSGHDGCPWFWDMMRVPAMKWGEPALPSLGSETPNSPPVPGTQQSPAVPRSCD